MGRFLRKRWFKEDGESEEEFSSGKRLLRPEGSFDRDPQKRSEQIKKLSEYCASLDVLALCYHGTGRSGNFVREIPNWIDADINADNSGIERLASKVSKLGLSKDEQNQLLQDIAEALSQAKRILMFDKMQAFDRQRERLLAVALLHHFDQKGKKVAFAYEDGFAETINSLLRDHS